MGTVCGAEEAAMNWTCDKPASRPFSRDDQIEVEIEKGVYSPRRSYPMIERTTTPELQVSFMEINLAPHCFPHADSFQVMFVNGSSVILHMRFLWNTFENCDTRA